MELFAATEEEKTVEKMISEAKNADEFFKLMRKPMKIQNRQKFRKKLLENEENLIDFIKEKHYGTRRIFSSRMCSIFSCMRRPTAATGF